MTLSRLLVAAVIGLGIACTDTSGPSIPEVAGQYSLSTIGSARLPVERYYDASYDTQIDYIGGDLVLGIDSTFSITYRLKYTKGTLGGRVPPGQEFSYALSGTYSVRSDSIWYRFTVGDSPLIAKLAIVGSQSLEAPTDGSPIAVFDRP
jgi:hypothetical protein